MFLMCILPVNMLFSLYVIHMNISLKVVFPLISAKSVINSTSFNGYSIFPVSTL